MLLNIFQIAFYSYILLSKTPADHVWYLQDWLANVVVSKDSSKSIILQYLLINQIVWVKNEQLAWEMDCFSYLGQMRIISQSQYAKRAFSADLERSEHFMMNRSAECVQKSTLFFFKSALLLSFLQAFLSCDVCEIKNLALLVFNCHGNAFHNDCFISFFIFFLNLQLILFGSLWQHQVRFTLVLFAYIGWHFLHHYVLQRNELPRSIIVLDTSYFISKCLNRFRVNNLILIFQRYELGAL